MSPHLLLFGATGRSGQVIAAAARAAGWEVEAPSHAACPLEDAAAVSDLVLGSRAQLVVNAAAVSRLEACAEDALRTHLINAVAPAAMALACRHTGARFIHLSTDYVLDGRRPGLKDENAHLKPLSVYALSKREGELQVQEALSSALILRVSWINGNPQKPSFIEQTLAKALAGQPLAAIADQDSLPTDAADIARAVLSPVLAGVASICQLCSTGEPLTRLEVARIALDEAVRLGALPAVPPVERQALDRVPYFREPRPRHTAMDNAKLRALGLALPTAEACIRTITRRFLAAR